MGGGRRTLQASRRAGRCPDAGSIPNHGGPAAPAGVWPRGAAQWRAAGFQGCADRALVGVERQVDRDGHLIFPAADGASLSKCGAAEIRRSALCCLSLCREAAGARARAVGASPAAPPPLRAAAAVGVLALVRPKARSRGNRRALQLTTARSCIYSTVLYAMHASCRRRAPPRGRAPPGGWAAPTKCRLKPLASRAKNATQAGFPPRAPAWPPRLLLHPQYSKFPSGPHAPALPRPALATDGVRLAGPAALGTAARRRARVRPLPLPPSLLSSFPPAL